MLKQRIRSAVDRLVGGSVEARTDTVRMAVGSLESRLATILPEPSALSDTEFKAFSQAGEDGIIQFLVRRLSPPPVFVEIGVGDYSESNTRFLLANDNWRGVIVNGGTDHQEFVRRTGLAWRHSIDAVSAFVTAENVNQLILDQGVKGEIGLLSVDVDGVDYWLWNAIDAVSPWIVVAEVNSVWGPDAAVTVPYDPAFQASAAHWSGLYSGASLAALHHLAKTRGYRLVGLGSNGVNAFFVRDDVAGDLWDLTPREAYVPALIRTMRTREGGLAYTGDDHEAVLRTLRDLPLHDVVTGDVRTVAEVYDL